MKKKMLILTNRTLHNGPRMIREFDTFQHDFAITAIGTTAPRENFVEYHHNAQFLPLPYKIFNAVCRRLYYRRLTNRIMEYYPVLEKYIRQKSFDVIIIHDPVYLPLITRLKQKMKFVSVYNAHEYHPLEFEDRAGWQQGAGRYQYALYKNYLGGIDLLINVCNGIATKCEIEFQKSSLVIPNVATRSTIAPTKNDGPLRLIYHGAIMPSRNIEDMIDVMKLLGDNFQLDLMGVVSKGNESYMNHLQTYAQSIKNVSFIPPVAFDRIIPTINNYDIGLFLLRPNNFNYTHALPNKLYEFVQAKLAIAIGPSLEMQDVVERYDLGVVSEDFSPESLAHKIRKMTRADISRFKANAVVASQTEHAAHYSARYLEKLKSLLS